MAKSLDFNKVTKHYLTVTLADEKNTVLMIGAPTKAIMDELLVLQNKLNTVTEAEATSEDMDDLYTVCAKLMSRNKAGKEITGEFLAPIFDFEDISIFVNAYMDFIDEVIASKN